jgi:predicted dehydrogenase
MVRVYDHYQELANAPDVDAVMDLTAHGEHHLVADRVLSARKHLLSQKPLAATMLAGRGMLDHADRVGVTFGTFECFRFMPQTFALDWLVRSGRLGSLQMMLYGYLGAWWAPDRIVAHTPWRHRRDQGGGITVDIGVHFFDQMRTLAGEPSYITGRTQILEPIRRSETETIPADADDTVWASIDFESGASAQLSASWAGHGGGTTFGSGSVFLGTLGKVDGPQVMLDDGTRADLGEMYRREGNPSPGVPGVDDWFALAQQDWLEGIRHGRSPTSSGEEGLRNLAASLAILESSTAGRTVHFDEVWSGRLATYQEPIDIALGLKEKR